jgi:formylglycine-generating enzyme required for sulfatase activity
MAGAIFINYRRGDDGGNAGRLFDCLRDEFASEQLFMDVDSIAPGLDFVQVLQEQVARCDVLLVVIGKNWLDARDEEGARRLDDPDDFVRIEIEAALRQGKRVIPVLVGEGRMPRPDALPDAIRPLARRNGVRLTHERFRADVQGLIKALHHALDETGIAEPARPEVSASFSAEHNEPRPATLEQIAARRDVLPRPETEPALPAHNRTALPKLVALAIVVVAVGGLVWVLLPEWRSPTKSDPRTPVIEANATAPLSPQQERALKPNDIFRECAACPEMVVVPAGSFTMGSPVSEKHRDANEGPQRAVTFARPFAVARFAVTFDEWDACIAEGGCNGYRPADQGWGRGRRPAINVSLDDANAYAGWLSKKTGMGYRLLSEAEREYATRAGTQTAYFWGDEIGKANANCGGCGSRWDYRHTAPVGSFAPNRFGLFDMHGNVLEWVEDCYHDNYSGAPTDGSAWTTGLCNARVARGGAWTYAPQHLRSASRVRSSIDNRLLNLGFRVGRTLAP